MSEMGTNDSTRMANLLVLLVDDDEDFLFQEKVLLEAAGYKTVTAGSHEEAKRILARTKPDVAIVDLMMEEMDAGFSLCYHIKKKHPSVPVIMVSAVISETGLEFDATTDEERLWIKADAFLSKPIRFEQLQRELDRLLQRR